MSFSSGINVGTLTATFNLNAAPAQAAITAIVNQTNTLKQAFNTTYRVNVDASQATASINKATEAANGFKRALEFGGALLAFVGIEKAFGAISNAAVGLNATLQQTQVAFTALTGSATTAATLVTQLEAVAAHSTFGLAQLQQAAQQMLAFGVAAKNVPPLIQAVQTAAAASGGDVQEKFQRISYVISELSSGMQLSERQLRQLAMAGVPLNALAAQLGITVEQLQNAGKTGEVTSAQVVAAFQKMETSGRLGDFMQQQTQTFTGAMSVIRTNVGFAIAQAFQPLFKVISDVAVKIGEFVQTATFQRWAAETRAVVQGVISVFQALFGVIGSLAQAIAGMFGLHLGLGPDVQQQMDAVKNATVDVGQYDAALQSAGRTTQDTKAQLADYTKTIDNASLAIVGLNDQLAQNQVLLDRNAAAIKAVKDQYDPVIKSAEQSIRDINTPTADELARKRDELQLDKQRADLELTKPDVSGYDATIQSLRDSLNVPKPDTSGYDAQIQALDEQLSNFDASRYTAGIDARIQGLQENDPAAGIKAEIQSIQEAISGLNTDELDQKINAIRDKLSEPAPDTTGLSDQLAVLSGQIEAGGPGADAARQRYGALSAQKAGVLRQYDADQNGLKGQLTLLERERADQVAANDETRKADEKRIADLTEQVKLIDASTKSQLDDLRAQRTEAEARATADRKALEERKRGIEQEKQAVEKADAQHRQAVESQIKSEESARVAALAPYEAALKKITDQQEQDRLHDQAAAQRALDLAPYQAALDKAKATEDAMLAPLDAEKDRLGEIKTALDEQKRAQELAKQEAEANAKALKDGADSAGLSDQAVQALGKSAQETAPALATVPQGVQNIIDTLNRLSDFIKNDVVPALRDFHEWWDAHVLPKLMEVRDYVEHTLLPTLGRLKDWLGGDGLTAAERFTDWAKRAISPLLPDLNKVFGDFVKVLGDLKDVLGITSPLLDAHHTAYKALGELINTVVLPIFVGFITTGLKQLDTVLRSIQTFLTADWATAITKSATQLRDDFKKEVEDFTHALGTEGLLGALSGIVTFMGKEWLQIGEHLAKPFNDALGPIKDFLNQVFTGVNWIASKFGLGAPTNPLAGQATTIGGGLGDIGGSSGGGVAGAGPGYASGVFDSQKPGHLAVVGERGPEVMFVPQHATIIPHHMASGMGLLPGHADGLNLGGLLDGALGAVGGKIRGFGAGLVDTMMHAIGAPMVDDLIPGLGAGLVSMTTQAIKGLIAPFDHRPVAGRATAHGGAGGPLSPLAALINDAAARYGVPADIIGAIILHESGGNIGQVEIGGGLGRGLMQVDGGTWPQAYDPRMSGTSLDDAAYQIDVGTMILKQSFDAAGGDVGGALTNYAGGGFAGVHGRTFYQELQDMGLIAEADSELAGGGATGAASGDVAVVEGMPGDQLMGIAQSVRGAFLYCEKFVGDVMQAAGLRYARAGTAREHADMQGLNDGFGPLGAITFFSWTAGDGVDYGHVGFSMGDGQSVYGTVSPDPQGDQTGVLTWGGPGLLGWTDNPALNGGMVNEPVLGVGLRSGQSYSFAEDGRSEMVVPHDAIAGIGRGGGGGGGGDMIVNFNAGSIVAAPGMDTRDVANAVVRAIDDRYGYERRRRGMA